MKCSKPRFLYLPKETSRPPLTQIEKDMRYTWLLVNLGILISGSALIFATCFLLGRI